MSETLGERITTHFAGTSRSATNLLPSTSAFSTLGAPDATTESLRLGLHEQEVLLLHVSARAVQDRPVERARDIGLAVGPEDHEVVLRHDHRGARRRRGAALLGVAKSRAHGRHRE